MDRGASHQASGKDRAPTITARSAGQGLESARRRKPHFVRCGPWWQRVAGVVALSVTGLGAAACSGLGNTSTQVSCAVGTTGASVIFEGVVMPGPVATVGGHSVALSPARLQVTHYLKGDGPTIVMVSTGVSGKNGVVTVTEDGILPIVNQTWKIYATSVGQPFQTSICAGSHVIGTGQGTSS
jgi:hypothetical protein